MPDPIFERYKEVLKAGHVAVLQGRLDDALDRYREAAAIAADRPLPHSSIGNVLLRQGHVDDALAAYSRALGRAPRDEAALNGRAEALLAADRRPEAAEVLERLADVQAESGREPEAVATLQRALHLHETKRGRRRLDELTMGAAATTADGAVGISHPAEPGTEPAAGSGAAVAAEPNARAEPAPSEPGAAEAPASAVELGEPDADEDALPAQVVPASTPPVALAHPDPEAFLEDAETARDAGRTLEALALYVLASDAYARAGAHEAALEVCQRALEVGPDAPAVHLALARLYFARNWRERAVEKVVLIDRLLDLQPAPAARRELAALAAANAALDGRLAAIAGDRSGTSQPAA
ncbi:MAG TPA: tetratricopeptide repeat protein [Candidatus Dormibacteraeota bacterium]|nr:tetratricopeptide repeat protein [Candidatus Dormibacteraeota bacterium]